MPATCIIGRQTRRFAQRHPTIKEWIRFRTGVGSKCKLHLSSDEAELYSSAHGVKELKVAARSVSESSGPPSSATSMPALAVASCCAEELEAVCIFKVKDVWAQAPVRDCGINVVVA